MEKKTGFNLGYLIFALLAVMWLREGWIQAQTVETVPYSRFGHQPKARLARHEHARRLPVLLGSVGSA